MKIRLKTYWQSVPQHTINDLIELIVSTTLTHHQALANRAAPNHTLRGQMHGLGDALANTRRQNTASADEVGAYQGRSVII